MADSGKIDAFRLVHGEAKGGHSRQVHTIHTRIDRIYTQAYDSIWKWQRIGFPPDLFTGAAHSDHLPVVARLTIAKERPPSETDAKINPAVFDYSNTRVITTLLWRRQMEKYPPATHGHGKGWTMAKQAVATYLLDETNEMLRKTSPISSIKNKIRTTHAALNERGPSPILTAKMKSLNEELEKVRVSFSHNAHSAQ
jgi:hypothetical protein